MTVFDGRGGLALRADGIVSSGGFTLALANSSLSPGHYQTLINIKSCSIQIFECLMIHSLDLLSFARHWWDEPLIGWGDIVEWPPIIHFELQAIAVFFELPLL